MAVFIKNTIKGTKMHAKRVLFLQIKASLFAVY